MNSTKKKGIFCVFNELSLLSLQSSLDTLILGFPVKEKAEKMEFVEDKELTQLSPCYHLFSTWFFGTRMANAHMSFNYAINKNVYF